MGGNKHRDNGARTGATKKCTKECLARLFCFVFCKALRPAPKSINFFSFGVPWFF